MATQIKVSNEKTYATEANAVKAVADYPENLRYIVIKLEDGRYAPVFVGESAVQAGVFFRGFSVIG